MSAATANSDMLGVFTRVSQKNEQEANAIIGLHARKISSLLINQGTEETTRRWQD